MSHSYLFIQFSQKACITGNTRRSKSAVPGWYKRMSMGSNNASSDMQHAGMSPSARFVTSSKNGALVKSAYKNNDIASKQYLLNHLSCMSRNLSDSPKHFSPRARSLPRWRQANDLEEYDRENGEAGSTDLMPPRSQSSTLMDRLSSNRDNSLSSTEAEYIIGESLQDMEKAIMNGATPSPEDKDRARSFKRRVNINLNELDPIIPDDKKTLSMDINVIVSVKSPENGPKPEIGFQELPGPDRKYETQKYLQSREQGTLGDTIESTDIGVGENWKITDSEAAENLKFGSDNGLFSQKDITEEIGRVYNFLKSNGGPKSISRNNNPRSTLVQNYDAIKKLYVNALGCVKACQELKNNVAAPSYETDSEFADVINELEGCFFVEDDKANQVKYTEYSINPRGIQRRHLLSGARTGSTSIRMYSSGSDCEKAKKLPCLQSSDLSKDKGNAADAKTVCEKLCMPCCKPARDPPRCFYPYHKPPCQKLKPPRPAFSECKQMFEMKQISPCECVRPRATRCKKSDETQTCDKQ